MAEIEEELKSPLMKVKEESKKVGLKLNIQKTKIMTSCPITSWQTDRETVEDFILGGGVGGGGVLQPWNKKMFTLGRKIMTNLDSILKSRDITLSTNLGLVKVIVFPVVMYGCESSTTKKAEHWGIYAFELWCWERLLRAPWSERWSNQSIMEGLILKLKLQFLDHLMQRADSFEKSLMLGKVKDRRRRGQQRMR